MADWLGGLGSFGASLGLPGAGDPSKIYGTKPVVPTIGAETSKALADSLAALPGAEELAGKVNQFSQEQKNKMLSFVAPGWQENFNLAGDDIEKMLMGVLPSSDAAQSQIQSVAGALGGGFGGTPAMTNLVARDLGLRQQDLIEKGLSANDRWLRTAETLTSPMFDFTKFFATPSQEMQRDWQANVIAAAPDPVARGESEAWNQLIGEVLSIYGGGGGWKGGYTPQYGQQGPMGPAGPQGPAGSDWIPQSSGTDININTYPGAGGQDINPANYAMYG